MSEIINSFPGYEFKRLEDGKYHNMYRGIDLGRGGWVYSAPGIYTNVALIDAASLHPTSIILLNKLGKYTQRYKELREARVLIKHRDYEAVSKLFEGRLAKYLESEDEADELSSALKIPLNSFYGISTASYENPARDSRDKNNIIALRGALFMKTLFDAVEEQGYFVVHIKTDSIKIANADDKIIRFVQEFGRKYGYEMEHEATYERMCLIDKAQYIARYDDKGIRNKGGKHANEWTATGAEFQQPYVYKTIFTGEPIDFEDLCETKTVTGGAIYLDMNEGLPNVDIYEKEIERRRYNSEHPNDPKKLKKLNPDFEEWDDATLKAHADKGHNYIFVGRAGRFAPIRSGCGGGEMVREKDGKYYGVTGTVDWRWLEAEVVKQLGMEDRINRDYHEKLVDEAIAFINEYGDFERFVDTSRPYEVSESSKPKVENDIPFDLVPCGDNRRNSCIECPNYKGDDICGRGYSLTNYITKGGGANDA